MIAEETVQTVLLIIVSVVDIWLCLYRVPWAIVWRPLPCGRICDGSHRGLPVANAVARIMGGEPFVRQWSVIPADLVAGKGWVTIFSAMFMHGGWMHIIGNLVFLHAFGPEVEDAIGRLGFLTFYLLSGIAATLARS